MEMGGLGVERWKHSQLIALIFSMKPEEESSAESKQGMLEIEEIRESEKGQFSQTVGERVYQGGVLESPDNVECPLEM